MCETQLFIYIFNIYGGLGGGGGRGLPSTKADVHWILLSFIYMFIFLIPPPPPPPTHTHTHKIHFNSFSRNCITDMANCGMSWNFPVSTVKTVIPLSLSEAERKLVVMDSFSEVVNFARIPAFLDDHGSKDSSKPSDLLRVSFFCRQKMLKYDLYMQA